MEISDFKEIIEAVPSDFKIVIENNYNDRMHIHRVLVDFNSGEVIIQTIDE